MATRGPAAVAAQLRALALGWRALKVWHGAGTR
ncbi:hypothetical protein FHS40_002817 [Streptomyces spectabilis]|uniref:Uncharacterized protein n=1 Tax=Streptomyces spectabilis TaxID=68270 RepID=A0A7W8ASB4_STRST|nr:hypothetical protein [Streptomyces spectabilis]